MKSRLKMLVSVVIGCFLIFSYQLSSAAVIMNEAGRPLETTNQKEAADGRVLAEEQEAVDERASTEGQEAADEQVITEVPPECIKGKSYMVPTSISNFNATVNYKTDAKEIEYTIDLKAVLETRTAKGKFCFEADLSRANVEIIDKNAEGIQTKTLLTAAKDADGKYTSIVSKDGYRRSVSGSTITLSAIDPDQVVHAGESHIINIYFPTQFNEGIVYGPEAAEGSYLQLLRSIESHPELERRAVLTISRKPKCMEEVRSDAGEVVTEAEFSSVPKVDMVKVKVDLREMPQIN